MDETVRYVETKYHLDGNIMNKRARFREDNDVTLRLIDKPR